MLLSLPSTLLVSRWLCVNTVSQHVLNPPVSIHLKETVTQRVSTHLVFIHLKETLTQRVSTHFFSIHLKKDVNTKYLDPSCLHAPLRDSITSVCNAVLTICLNIQEDDMSHLSLCFHAWRRVYRVSEETVTRHLQANDSGHDWTRMNALQKNKKTYFFLSSINKHSTWQNKTEWVSTLQPVWRHWCNVYYAYDDVLN